MQSSSLDSASPAIGPAQELNTGQRRWLAEVYEANYLGVVRLCTRLLRNPEDAADAAQDVFVIAANSLDPGAPPAQARAWLLTVARNHCLDLLRRRTRLGKALVTLPDGRQARMLGPGDGFGDLALLFGRPRSATVTAVGPLVVAALERSDFLALVRRSGETEREFRSRTGHYVGAGLGEAVAGA